MNRFLASAAVCAAIALSAPAGAQLSSQRTDGVHRICVYENRGASIATERYRTRVIGLSEVCPGDYTPPVGPSRRSTIPSMATLQGERFERGEKLCVYTYLGRQYRRPIDRARRCPYTPHYFD